MTDADLTTLGRTMLQAYPPNATDSLATPDPFVGLTREAYAAGHALERCRCKRSVYQGMPSPNGRPWQWHQIGCPEREG